MVNYINDLFGKKEIGRTLAAVFGTLVFALGINLFVVPVHVYSGGIMGICQIIRTVLARFFHIDFGNIDIAGIIYYIANIPLFFLAFRTMGKLFFVKTMICTVMMTVFLTVIPIPPQLLVNDVLTCCLIGGIIAGVGTGLTLIMGGSGGGTDIIGLYYIKRKSKAGVGQVNLIINLFLYLVSFLLFDISTTIFSIIVAVADSLTIDKIHTQNINVQVMIISKNDLKKFQSDFMSTMGRGITKWTTTGAYTNMNSEMLFIIISKYEVNQLKQMVRMYDPDAFIVVNEGVRVDGHFTKKL